MFVLFSDGVAFSEVMCDGDDAETRGAECTDIQPSLITHLSTQ